MTTIGQRIDALNSPHAGATCDTTQFVYWRGNVLELVGALGFARSDIPDDWFAKLPLWFRSGEPVKMAAESLASVCDIERRARNHVLVVRPGMVGLFRRGPEAR